MQGGAALLHKKNRVEAQVKRLIERANDAQAIGQFAYLERTARELIEICTPLGDTASLSTAYRCLGTARHYAADASGAEQAYKKALAIAQEHEHEYEAALAMVALGNMALEQYSDKAEGLRLHLLAEPVVRASGHKKQIGILTGNLSEIARIDGDYHRALAYARESLDALREAGDEYRAGWQLTNIALIYALQRDYVHVLDALRTAWQTISVTPNSYWLAMYFDVCFLIAVQMERWEIAAQLSGFTAQYRTDHRVPRLLGLMTEWYPPALERFARSLRADRIGELRAEGANLSAAEAHRLAMQLFTAT
jgi:tetratricopeptide (TPR) repeat protein